MLYYTFIINYKFIMKQPMLLQVIYIYICHVLLVTFHQSRRLFAALTREQ